MAASDKFRQPTASTRPSTATLTAQKLIGAASITVDTTAGWTTATGTDFVIYQVDANGDKIAATQTDWVGDVSSSTSVTNLTLKAGTDQVYPVGSKVIATPTAAWGDSLVEGILVEHNQDGTHGNVTADTLVVDGTTTLTGNLDINDSSTAIRDSSDNELVKFSKTASAVNEITVKNAATGNAPEIQATGSDTNIDLKLVPKGTGRVIINSAGVPQRTLVNTFDTTTSTSYTDLASAGPAATATIGASGMALVTIKAEISINSTVNSVLASFAVSGASTVAASDDMRIRSTPLVSGAFASLSATFLLTGLTAGSNVFTMKYRVTGSTGSYERREITVVPL